MKKFIALLLAALMVLSLVACASKTETAEEPAAAETTTEETKTEETAAEPAAEETPAAEEGDKDLNVYGIYKSDSLYFVNEGWSLENSMKEIAEANGYTVSWHYLSCDMDPEKCMTLIENAIADKADAIVTCVPDQTMSIAVVERCNEAGVPVIAVDDGLIDTDGNKIAPWFGIDAYNIGYAAGEWMADYAKDNNLLDDEATGLLYMTMSTVSSCVPRTEGEKQAWADKLGDALADRTFEGDYESTMELAYNAASAVITANPQIKNWLVMVASENGALGSGSALEEAGLAETSCIVNLGGDEMINQWDAGNYAVVRGTAYFSGLVVGREAGTAIANYLINGTELPAEYATPAEMMDPTNYNEIAIRKEG